MILVSTLTPIIFRLAQIFAPYLVVYIVASFLLIAGYMCAYIATFTLGSYFA